MTKKVLFITHHKLNENKGGSNGSKGSLHCFATLFDNLAVLSPAFEGPVSPYIPSGVKLYHPNDTRSNLRKLVDMYRGVISPLYYAVRQHLKTHRYDIIVVDHSFSGAGLINDLKKTGAKIITIHHNVERDYLRDNSKERPVFYRYPFLYFSKKAERDCLKNSDINLTVTEHDASVFRLWYPDAHVYNWGNFEYLSIVDKSFEERQRRLTFVITGSLCFSQSIVPISLFINKYWPLVHQVYQDAKLLIAGRNPSKELQQICSTDKGILLIPNPEDIESVVQQADYYICPISEGSGRKLRILDGLRQGLPILCHDVSVSGYESIKDNHFLFSYHDEESFIESLRKITTTPISPDKVYQAYRKEFSLSTGIMRLETFLRKENIF